MRHLQDVNINNSYANDCASESKRKIKAHFVLLKLKVVCAICGIANT